MGLAALLKRRGPLQAAYIIARCNSILISDGNQNGSLDLDEHILALSEQMALFTKKQKKQLP
jgi:hypothetical protein